MKQKNRILRYLFFALPFVMILSLFIGCSNTMTGSGGGIEAGNSVIALSLPNADNYTAVCIVPESYIPSDGEIDSFAIFDTVSNSNKKQITLRAGTYSLFIKDVDSEKTGIVQNIIAVEKEKMAVVGTLSNPGILHIVKEDGNWGSGTYFFIPGTSLKYTLDNPSSSIKWNLPVALFDSVCIARSGNKDSIDLLSDSIIIKSDSIKLLPVVHSVVYKKTVSLRFVNMAVNNNGDIWVGCSPDDGKGQNIYKYNIYSNLWKSYDSSSSQYFIGGITDVTINSESTIFFGTTVGFVEFRDNTFHYEKHFNTGINNVKEILVGHDDQALFVYSFAISKYNSLFSNTSISGGTTVTIDLQNSPWVGTESSGVYNLSADSLVEQAHYTNANSGLASDTVICSCTDSSGVLWFGTDQGLCSFDGTKWKNNTGFSQNNHVKKIECSSSTKLIWFITESNKLYKIMAGTISFVSDFSDKLEANSSLVDISVDDASSIWILARNTGLIRIGQ